MNLVILLRYKAEFGAHGTVLVFPHSFNADSNLGFRKLKFGLGPFLKLNESRFSNPDKCGSIQSG
jgi:hypothetical protein